MRCDVLVTQESRGANSETGNTDVEIWRDASAYSNALATSGPRDMTKYTLKSGVFSTRAKKSSGGAEKVSEKCKKTENLSGADNGKSTLLLKSRSKTRYIKINAKLNCVFEF